MPLTWQRNTFPENDALLSEPYRSQTTCFRSCIRLQKVAENGAELKTIVFALFSQNEKSATRISSKLLIISVDQPGLEPGTSRL